MLRRLWLHRDLLVSLVLRQYQLRYRQSAVGFAWAIIPPLATLGVATLVFHRVARVDTGRTPYVVFTMSGLVLWTFFASSITTGVPSVINSLPTVTRFPFPRAVLPLSAVGLSMLDLLVSVVLFVIVVIVYGVGFSWSVLWLPLLVLLEVVLPAPVHGESHDRIDRERSPGPGLRPTPGLQPAPSVSGRRGRLHSVGLVVLRGDRGSFRGRDLNDECHRARAGREDVPGRRGQSAR